MNQKTVVINYLSKYIKGEIQIEDISNESNVFDFIELDVDLLPSEYLNLFLEKRVKVDGYMYGLFYIYFISSLDAPQTGILVGIVKEHLLLEYKFLQKGKEDV